MAAEAAPLRRRGLPADVTIQLCGMGPGAARRWIEAVLAGPRPAGVLSCGFAGGLDPARHLGDVLADAGGWPGLGPKLEAAGARTARFATEARVAVTAADKAAVRARTGADAVEMESGVIVSAGRAAGVPAAVVRVISDAAGDDLPLDFNALMTPAGRLSLPRLALAVAARPGRIPALVRLGRSSRRAAEKLADVLGRVLDARQG
ncbi:MAG TPA: hypothetical protein PKE47_01850 [Verrucomicrobiota bacterium]|nr:hypothetical protein [Verrucomicrobiota bacterium]